MWLFFITFSLHIFAACLLDHPIWTERQDIKYSQLPTEYGYILKFWSHIWKNDVFQLNNVEVSVENISV